MANSILELIVIKSTSCAILSSHTGGAGGSGVLALYAASNNK